MADFKFPNAPVTEAVLDLRVKLPAGFDMKLFDSYFEKVKADFPNKDTQRISSLKFDLKEQQASIQSDETNGLILKSADNSKVIQIRKDGFSFNKLRPYEDWATFNKDAKKYWDLYLELIRPEEVYRIAVRYINLIKVPINAKNFEEYFTTFPKIAPELPQLVSELLMRVVINDSNGSNTAIVTQAIDVSKLDGKTIPFIFDIDVFKEVSLKPDDSKIWDVLESQRNFKNEIFISSLTEKAKELFK
jgi:uncharacterized protein (TIGR04255 family)